MPYFSRPDLTLNDPMRWIEYEPWRVDRINTLLRRYVREHPDGARILDMNARVSPGGKYVDSIDGVLVRNDGVHFSADGADFVAGWLAPRLRNLATGVTQTLYPGVTVR
jgi:lysophospholipase L1-like esterase